MGTKLPEISNHRELPSAPQTPPAPPPGKRRRSYAGVWLLLLAALGFAGYKVYQNNQQQKQADTAKTAAKQANRPVSVVVAPVKTGDIPVYLRGLGTVTPFNTVVVKSRVDGQLIAIHFTEGQIVHQGDLLAEIDPRPFQVQLEQAQGQLAKDQAQLKDAQVNLERYQTLWKEGVIAKQQLDTQASSVGQFEGTIQADQANINNARLQLTYSKITAPLTGRVGLRLIDVGNIIHASDPNGLVVIDQMQPISVLFTIPADSLQPILQKLHQGAKLPVDGYDRDDKNKIASGTLLTVDNQDRPHYRHIPLKGDFQQHQRGALPQPICELPPAARHEAQCRHCSGAGAAARSARKLRLCRNSGGDCVGAACQRRDYRRRGRRSGCGSKGRRDRGRRGSGQAPGRQQNSDAELAPVHSAARRDLAADGRHPARGHRGLSAVARVGAAGGRLPDHSGPHVLSGREPRRDGFVGDLAAGAPVRPGARPQPDDLEQLVRQFGDHAPVRTQPQHRRGRAGGAGRDQCGFDLSAGGSAQSAHL